MGTDTYNATTLTRLLDAPTKDVQMQIAEAVSLFTCIEIAVGAYPAADPAKRRQIAVLLNRLYHALVRDSDYPRRQHWPALVEENYARFHRRTPWEMLSDGWWAAFELAASIPILGVVVIIVFGLLAALALGVLFVVTLPFPAIHTRISRYMDAWTTVAENAH